jgi:hypothetical protein
MTEEEILIKIKQIINDVRNSMHKPPPCSGYLQAEQDSAYTRGWSEALNASALVLEHAFFLRERKARE